MRRDSVTKPRWSSFNGRYRFSAATRNPLDVPPCCINGTTSAFTGGSRQSPVGSAENAITVEFDKHRFPRAACCTGQIAPPSAGSSAGAAGCPAAIPLVPARRASPLVVEEVGQRERQVAQVLAQLAVGEGQTSLLGAYHAGVGTQIPQRRHPPLADDLLRCPR